MSRSRWPEYFEALGDYLAQVRSDIEAGTAKSCTARPPRPPDGAVPGEQVDRAQALLGEAAALLRVGAERRVDVAGRLRGLDQRQRVATRDVMVDERL